MKLRHRSITAIILCLVMVLSGCQGAGPSEPVSYDNITFSDDFFIDAPEINSIKTFEMSKKAPWDAQKLYDYFEKCVDKYFPGVFSDKEKEEIYRYLGTDNEGNTISGLFFDFKEEILNGDVPTPTIWFTDEKGILEMYSNGSIQTVTGTKAFSLDYPNPERTVAVYCAAEENTIVEKIHIPLDGFEGDSQYNLLDGSEKLQTAIDYTINYLNDSYDPEVANPELIADITDVWIVDMGDDIYGYHFWLTYTYDDIRFDTYPMKSGLGFTTYDISHCKLYMLYPGYVFMIENNDIDSIKMFHRDYDIKNVVTHDKVLTYEEAFKIFAQSVAPGAKLEVKRAELVYTPYTKIKDDYSYLYVDAAWRFTVSNKSDGFRYIFFVNAVTGEVDYYQY